jgi:hypothetical protein
MMNSMRADESTNRTPETRSRATFMLSFGATFFAPVITSAGVLNVPPGHDPGLNAMVNPKLNASVNPNFNVAINPRYNAVLNPKYNAIINPNYNAVLNPKYNAVLNPQYNSILNPRFNVSLRPNAEGAKRFYQFDLDGHAVGTTIVASDAVMDAFDAESTWIRYFVSNQKDGYNGFTVEAKWDSYLIANSSTGFNLFDLDAQWMGYLS